MTTRPRLAFGRHLVPGVIAAGFFVLFAYVITRADIGEATGFPAGESVTANIGFALLNISGTIPSEGFLVAFILVAFLLDAALEGAVHLAKRENEHLRRGSRRRSRGEGER